MRHAAASEDGAAWLAFLRGLVPAALPEPALITSDAHPGLVDGIALAPGAEQQLARATQQESRRLTDVVVRLVGAVLAGQHDEWAVARRCTGADSIAKARTDPAQQPRDVIAVPEAA